MFYLEHIFPPFPRCLRLEQKPDQLEKGTQTKHEEEEAKERTVSTLRSFMHPVTVHSKCSPGPAQGLLSVTTCHKARPRLLGSGLAVPAPDLENVSLCWPGQAVTGGWLESGMEAGRRALWVDRMVDLAQESCSSTGQILTLTQPSQHFMVHLDLRLQNCRRRSKLAPSGWTVHNTG